MDQLDEPAGQTSWTDQLNRPAGRTSWKDQLDGPAGQTSSFYLKPWPVRILDDWPFSLYIVAASESDEGLVFEKLTAKSEKMCNATEHKPSHSYTDFGFSIIQISNDIIFTGPYNLIIIFYKSHYCMYDRLSYVCEFF